MATNHGPNSSTIDKDTEDDMGLKTAPKAGTVVRLTGKFLAQTGQQKGPEGMGRWKVVTCTSGLRSIPKVAGSPIAWEATGKPCDLCAGGQHVGDDVFEFADLVAAEGQAAADVLALGPDLGAAQVLGEAPQVVDRARSEGQPDAQ